ncbi:hypothetical protein HYG77_04960 [Rhodococcus sp. ZPP]|uniref:hypothetical protein n=1 Tax=Rhodococcus sp. ZPP TaxID=2749906 RepID=UPI001AD854E3|nr:hypothetical protein [Rhodococcus sp. ZPP]QTJ65013.1 hypothetical protein HYG77_04960 [Rhodococcus sp. ZPP]
MAADARLDDLARRIDAVPDSLPSVKSIYQAFHTLASNNSRPATAAEMIDAMTKGLDELDERLASSESDAK